VSFREGSSHSFGAERQSPSSGSIRWAKAFSSFTESGAPRSRCRWRTESKEYFHLSGFELPVEPCRFLILRRLEIQKLNVVSGSQEAQQAGLAVAQDRFIARRRQRTDPALAERDFRAKFASQPLEFQ